MFLSRNIMRAAATAAPRRFFSIDAAQHPISASREPSARVAKLAEVRACSCSLAPFPHAAHTSWQEFKSLTVLEAADLARILKKDLGLPDISASVAAPAAAAPAAAASAAAAPAAAEKTEFELKLESFGEQKIQVIARLKPLLLGGGAHELPFLFCSEAPISGLQVVKEVRTITGLGLKEAKDLVEGAARLIFLELRFLSHLPLVPPTLFKPSFKPLSHPPCWSTLSIVACVLFQLTWSAGAPKVVKGGLTKEEAAKFKDLLEKAGAKVSIS